MWTLLLVLAVQAGPRSSRAPAELSLGRDIAAFRALATAGLPDDQRLPALASFLAAYPRSPLAEVALGRYLELGGDPAEALAPLPPAERAHLVARFRDHRERLASLPPAGPVLSAREAEPTRRSR